MKKIKRVGALIVLICLIMAQTVPCIVSASESNTHSESLTLFVNSIASEKEDFSYWNGLNLIKAYDLYNVSGNEKEAELYYVGEKGIGYIIISVNGAILEFANGLPAYDRYTGTYSKAMYQNGGYFIAISDQIVRLYADGSIVKTSIQQPRAILDMDANLQGQYWCIPTAIANIMWYWNSNGFLGLTDGSFSAVQEEITNIMGNSVTANSGIASAVAVYTSYRGRTGSASSISATYSSIVSEINAGRPCLLGFAVGGGYSAAHMTACCGYYTTSYGNFAVVVDGHSSSHVYRTWGSYNDYVGRIRIS